MTLNFVLIVEDAGELKTVTATELIEAMFETTSDIDQQIDDALNKVLDARAIAAGEYDPSDNDTPMVIL